MNREEAEKLLEWAGHSNPGPWTDHAKVAARAAEAIAKAAGLNPERAYMSGLLHDIGRYEGVRGLHHVIAGYELLREKGFADELAEICLSHSFPYQELGAYSGGDWDCTEDEIAVIREYLARAEYSDYDRLIQLCDSLALAEGVCLIEKRLVNVVTRYGFNEFTLKKWAAFYEIKAYFDERVGGNVYDLFYDEVREVTFQ